MNYVGFVSSKFQMWKNYVPLDASEMDPQGSRQSGLPKYLKPQGPIQLFNLKIIWTIQEAKLELCGVDTLSEFLAKPPSIPQKPYVHTADSKTIIALKNKIHCTLP